MRVWRYQGFHRVTWVVLVLLILAVAVFAMAAGFARLRGEVVPAGTGEASGVGAGPLESESLGADSAGPSGYALTDLGSTPASV